jgi:hypothetical protein
MMVIMKLEETQQLQLIAEKKGNRPSSSKASTLLSAAIDKQTHSRRELLIPTMDVFKKIPRDETEFECQAVKSRFHIVRHLPLIVASLCLSLYTNLIWISRMLDAQLILPFVFTVVKAAVSTTNHFKPQTVIRIKVSSQP